MTENRRTQILDTAEAAMRKGGFDAVSFRDIAGAIGIKSASVHYHFPTKADLGQAVAERYTDRFLDGLGSATEGTPAARIDRLAEAYRAAYASERATCLCTVLGSVIGSLPDATAAEVGVFYDRLLGWVECALEANGPLSPTAVVSILQGAMVLAIATGEDTPLRDARTLLSGLMGRD